MVARTTAEKVAEDNELLDGPPPAPYGATFVVAFPLGLNVAVPKRDGGKATGEFDRTHVKHLEAIPDGVNPSEIATLLALGYLVAKQG